MINALISGERDPAVLADLARGLMRKKIPDLTMALSTTKPGTRQGDGIPSK
jgi:hypothetical protein